MSYSNEEKKAIIVDMIAKGNTYTEIAKFFDTRYSCIRDFTRQYNIDTTNIKRQVNNNVLNTKNGDYTDIIDMVLAGNTLHEIATTFKVTTSRIGTLLKELGYQSTYHEVQKNIRDIEKNNKLKVIKKHLALGKTNKEIAKILRVNASVINYLVEHNQEDVGEAFFTGKGYSREDSTTPIVRAIKKKLRGVKYSARTRGITCTITFKDIRFPTRCPILGVKLDYSSKGTPNKNTAEFDRINPVKGYIPGNVVVMSRRANQIKNNATSEEFDTLVYELMMYTVAGYTVSNLIDHESKARDIIYRVRYRAKKRGLPFNLSVDDIRLPKYCPLLGIKLNYRASTTLDSSPSLDKINPSKGYVKGNVWVISHKANRLKSNASTKELIKVRDWLATNSL